MVMTAAPPLQAFAEWVKGFRIHLDLTQRQMADLIGVALPSLQKWEYGAMRPSASSLTMFRLLAEKHHYPSPPDMDTGRGPRVP